MTVFRIVIETESISAGAGHWLGRSSGTLQYNGTQSRKRVIVMSEFDKTMMFDEAMQDSSEMLRIGCRS